MVKEDRATGIVGHQGSMLKGGLAELKSSSGGLVLGVDEARRRECARVHSAGHALDVAMIMVGHKHLKATKGYHVSPTEQTNCPFTSLLEIPTLLKVCAGNGF